MNGVRRENTGSGSAGARPYLIGFIAAAALTLISFAAVTIHGLSRSAAAAWIATAAVAQMLVHLRYFLHIDKSREARLNVAALIFTALLLFIFVGGTLWVMHTLNSRMM